MSKSYRTQYSSDGAVPQLHRSLSREKCNYSQPNLPGRELHGDGLLKQLSIEQLPKLFKSTMFWRNEVHSHFLRWIGCKEFVFKLSRIKSSFLTDTNNRFLSMQLKHQSTNLESQLFDIQVFSGVPSSMRSKPLFRTVPSVSRSLILDRARVSKSSSFGYKNDRALWKSCIPAWIGVIQTFRARPTTFATTQRKLFVSEGKVTHFFDTMDFLWILYIRSHRSSSRIVQQRPP